MHMYLCNRQSKYEFHLPKSECLFASSSNHIKLSAKQMFYISASDAVNVTLCFRQICFLCFYKVFFTLLVSSMDICVFLSIFYRSHTHLCIYIYSLYKHTYTIIIHFDCDSLHTMAFLEFTFKLK